MIIPNGLGRQHILGVYDFKLISCPLHLSSACLPPLGFSLLSVPPPQVSKYFCCRRRFHCVSLYLSLPEGPVLKHACFWCAHAGVFHIPVPVEGPSSSDTLETKYTFQTIL